VSDPESPCGERTHRPPAPSDGDDAARRPPDEAGEAFQRGHLDHVALDVDDIDTFEELRHRLVDCGASDGTATDFGMVRTVAFRDPDGWWGEIAHWKDGEPLPLDEAAVETFDA
jgi:catechol 2,3-dioxygenase-like lactoylglutathione lyase family enzyme